MATLYCGPSNTGSGTGADFNNLLALPNTTGFTRGNTYIVVDGSYGSKTLSTATSSTTTITIKKASAADSAVAGYSSTLHDGQATFGTINIVTQYWILDGVTRTVTNSWTEPTGYGFRIDGITANSNNGDDADFSQVRYADIGATWETNPSAGTIASYGNPIYLVYNQTDITFSYCALHNGVGTLMQGAGANNITFEYCDIGPGWGKEALRGGNFSSSAGWIIRYCRFWNASQTDPNDGTSGITAEIGIWKWFSGATSGFEVYGNWFYNNTTGGRNAVIVIGGTNNGWEGDGANGTKCYNNTFAGLADKAGSLVILNGASTEAKNNLSYDAGSGYTASTTSNNVASTSNPFVGFSTQDYRIVSTTGGTYPRNAGANLGSPYNTDPLGVTRGADGTWDVGAYEYDAGGSAPNAPTNLRLI